MSDVKDTATAASPADVEKAEVYPPNQTDVGSMRKHVESNDPDEAFQLVSAEAITLNPEDEKKLLRKIDFHLMPLLCIIYGLNYLDKTTLSYASIMGIKVSYAMSRMRRIFAKSLVDRKTSIFKVSLTIMREILVKI